MDEKIRQIGIEALSEVMKKRKNCKLFEEKIHTQSAEKSTDEYFWYIYQTCGLLLEKKSGWPCCAGLPKSGKKSLLKDIAAGRVGWKSSTYDNVARKIQEHDDYVVSPFQVMEGVIKCPKCEGLKTWSFPKQIRSSDEGTSTFARCVNCNYSWVYTG